MRRRTIPYLLATMLTSGAMVLAAGCASEGTDGELSDCGDINVEASATCELELTGGCEVACEPLNFTAECFVDCEGECSASLSVECTGSCEASCQGECEVDPGSLDCQGSCEVDCNAGCSGQCSASNNQAECEGQCEASCEGECGISCEGTPPSASCEAKCSASCEGSCTAEANMDCHIDCQGGCSAELQGGCTAQCESPDGALFCDGQYVDHNGNLESCIAALNAYLSVDVETSGSAACDGSSCTAEGSCSASSIGPKPSSQSLPWFAAGLAALGIAAARRRRRS